METYGREGIFSLTSCSLECMYPLIKHDTNMLNFILINYFIYDEWASINFQPQHFDGVANFKLLWKRKQISKMNYACLGR